MFRPVFKGSAPSLSAADRRELLKLRSDVAALEVQHRLGKLAAVVLKYDPSQPRAPAGQSNGGQWVHEASHDAAGREPRREDPAQEERHDTASDGWVSIDTERTPSGAIARQTFRGADGTVVRSDYAPPPGANWTERHAVTLPDGTVRVFENEGLRQTIYDGEGRKLSVTDWTPNGPEPVATVQQAFLVPLAPFVIEKTAVAAMALYITWATREDGPGIPVLALPTRAFRQQEGGAPIYVGQLTEAETRSVCKEYRTVQNITTDATVETDRSNYRTAAEYGTAIHKKVSDKVIEENNPNLKSEISVLKTLDETGEPPKPDHHIVRYGKLGSARIDVLELAKANNVCVYDIKTGKSRLLPGRSAEIVNNAYKAFPNAQLILVIEMRSRR